MLDLPLDHPRPAVKTFGATRVVSPLATTLPSIKALGAAQGCTPFMTLLAAYVTLLHRLSGASDIIVGIPVSGRRDLEDTRVAGFCTHMLPVPVRIDGLIELKLSGRRGFTSPHRVTIRLGDPVTYPPDTDPNKIAADLERRVKAL